MSADAVLTSIEVILADIERLDAETHGQFRQASDRQALAIISRIERKMQANQKPGVA